MPSRTAGAAGELRERGSCRGGVGSGNADLEPVAADLALQVGGRPLGDHAAVVDDRDAVGETVGLLEVLGREQHRRAAVDERLDRVPERDPAAEVEPRRRLVEEQDRRPRDERGGEVEAAAHPARVGADEAAACIGEPELVEQLGRTRACRSSPEVVQAAHQLEVLEAGEVVVDGGVLPREPDLLAHAAGAAQHVNAGDPGRTAVRLEQGRQDPDGGRLACAVRAQEPQHGGGLGAESHLTKRLHGAEALPERVDLDGWRARHPRSISVRRGVDGPEAR